ncbi:MAG: hypothetical protein ACOX2R_09675 [Anaerolineae bacterium]|jgi:hypothetical protein
MKLHRTDLRQAVGDVWARMRDGASGLRVRLSPEAEPQENLNEVEGVVKDVLRPVAPTADFRQSLRSSLDRAELVRREGISISDPPPYREGILLGLGATVLAIAATITWLIFRWRAKGRAAS